MQNVTLHKIQVLRMLVNEKIISWTAWDIQVEAPSKDSIILRIVSDSEMG